MRTTLTRPRLPSSASLLFVAAIVASPGPAAGQRPDPASEPGKPAEIACAPRLASSIGDRALTVVGSHEGTAKSFFGPTDTLIISGGRADGIDVGQEYFVRRLVSPGRSIGRTAVLHTAGWVRIIATEREASVAEVIGVCGSLQRGDFLEHLQWPDPLTVNGPGEPDYDHSGTIMFGLDGRSLLAEHDYFVLSLGDADGLAAGQRLTVFRHTLGGLRAVTELGEAIAVAVESDTTTARIIHLRGNRRSRRATTIGSRSAAPQTSRRVSMTASSGVGLVQNRRPLGRSAPGCSAGSSRRPRSARRS